MRSLNEAREYLGIQKSTLYAWMKVTKVSTTKEGGKAYFTDEAIAQLQQLKVHLDNEGTFESWGQSELVKTSPNSILEARGYANEPNAEILKESPHSSIDPMGELVENAQRQAAGVLIAQNMLARKFIDDPDSLPPELQEMINKSKPVPKSIDPLEYAQTLTGMNLDFLKPQEIQEPAEAMEPLAA